MKNNFFKKNPKDKIWWVDILNDEGEIMEGLFAFSFDGNEIFYLFGDYPDKLTKEEKELFDKENPFWVEFFSDRQ